MKIGDESPNLVQRIEKIQRRIEAKLDRRSTDGAGPSRAEALEELRVSVEELRVASEELRRQTEDLARERQRYLDLFNFAPDAYLVTDSADTVEEANVATVGLLQCPERFLIGKPLVVFVAASQREAFRMRLNRLRLERTAKVEDWDITIQPRAGHSFPASVTVGPIRDAASRLTGIRWLLRPRSD
jgi:PAS domain S-box-containing protein